MADKTKFSFFTRFLSSLSTKKAAVIILITGLIVYGNTFLNGFVWDDNVFIVNNPGIYSIDIPYLFGSNMFNAISYYRPISALYFAFLYSFFGSHAFFYHFFQIALHIINAILVYIVLRIIFEKSDTKNVSSNRDLLKSLAFFLSLIFLVHPINVESVAYVAASQSELLFLFGILALYISTKERISVKRIIFISVLLLLSLLTKEVGFLFLFMVLFFQLLFYKQRFFTFFLADLITLSIYCFIRFAIGGVFFDKIITDTPLLMQKLSFFERLTSIPAIIWYYVSTVFFPLHLAVQQRWVITDKIVSNFYLPLLGDSLVFIIIFLEGIYIFKHRRNYFQMYLFFLLWFFSGLLMLLQIFPLDMTVADRWFYFPLLGLIGLLGIGILILLPFFDKYIFSRYAKGATIFALLGVSSILVFSLRTMIRNTNYRDEITLFTHDLLIKKDPIIENDLGVAYANAGNKEKALIYFQKSVGSYSSGSNLFNLAYTYELAGNIQKAKEYYYKALSYSESYILTLNNKQVRKNTLAIYSTNIAIYIRLGWVLLYLQEYTNAEKISKAGAQHYPDSEALWTQLAIEQNNLHEYEAALATAKMIKKMLQAKEQISYIL